MTEAREGSGGEAEKGESKGGVGGEGLDYLRGLGGGEREAAVAEVVCEVDQRGGRGGKTEDAGGGADKVAAGERVTAGVERRRGRGRGYGDGDGGAGGGRRRGCDAA